MLLYHSQCTHMSCDVILACISFAITALHQSVIIGLLQKFIKAKCFIINSYRDQDLKVMQLDVY